MNMLKLPDLGEGIEHATISTWYFEVGDQIKEGDDVVELATDKATFNVSATHSGVLKQKLAQKGDDVKIGGFLAIIE